MMGKATKDAVEAAQAAVIVACIIPAVTVAMVSRCETKNLDPRAAGDQLKCTGAPRHVELWL